MLAKYGKGPLTWDVKLRLQGLPGKAAGEELIRSYDLPITWDELNDLNIKIQEKYWPKTRYLPGAVELLSYLHEKGIPIGLCTSSTTQKLLAKTSHLPAGFNYIDVVVTADHPNIRKGRGKPFPDIWQIGLKSLNEKFGTDIKPEECLVFEDAVLGVKSAKAFNGQVVFIPHPEAIEYLGDIDAILDGKGEMLHSLTELDKTKYGL